MSDIGRFSSFGRSAGHDAEADVHARRDKASADVATGKHAGGQGHWTASDAALSQRFADALRLADGVDGLTGRDDPTEAAEARDTDPSRHEDPPPDGAQQLLAMSSLPAGYATPFALLAAPDTPTIRGGDAMADRINQLIDHAIRSDLAPLPGQPVEVALKLAGIVPGVDGLTVSMTSGAIDVVIQRSAAIEATDALRASAAGLADSLRQRFGKRIVRIYDRQPVMAATAPADATDGET
jgi:hypothetical protein